MKRWIKRMNLFISIIAVSAMLCCSTEALPTGIKYLCPYVTCFVCPKEVQTYLYGCPSCSNCPTDSTFSCFYVICPPPKICEVDSVTNKPSCVCPSVCTEQYDPVCGSDGKTYSNDCYLNIANCKSNGNITKVKDGECDPCQRLKCPSGRFCEVDPETNEASCNCPRFCPLLHLPVCGTDGKTYGNDCFLNIATCESNGKITKARDGECDPCKLVKCPKGKFCEVDPKTNQASCHCPGFCPLHISPVCGSDGKTYSNRCFLGIETCRSNGKVTYVSDGRCDATTKQ